MFSLDTPQAPMTLRQRWIKSVELFGWLFPRDSDTCQGSMQISVMEGKVTNVERTTSVSGGGDTQARTTFITLFSMGENRVLLKTPQPAMIANGDNVRVAGEAETGQFTAIACRNLSTGWTSSAHTQGCAIAAIAVMIVVTGLLTMVSCLFFPFPVFLGVILVLIIRHDTLHRKAHQLIA